jgi:hypothetical protein
MMAGALTRLSEWTAQPAFRELTVREAAQRLQELAPSYPGPFDQPVEICVNGCRWFAEEVEAVADAIHRAGRRPHRARELLGGPEWGILRNAAGLWAVTGPMAGRKSPGCEGSALIQSPQRLSPVEA